MDQKECWTIFAKRYDLDLDIGVLIKPEYKVSAFNFPLLQEKIQEMLHLHTEEELKKFFEEFPDIGFRREGDHSNTDMIILHSFMVFVVEKFLEYCKVRNKPVSGSILPTRVAFPLYAASQQIDMCPCMAYGQQYNWVKSNKFTNY